MTWVRGRACLRLCCLSWGTGNWALLWDITISRIMMLSQHTIYGWYVCPSHPFSVIIPVSCLHPQGLHTLVNFAQKISVTFGQGQDLQCLVNLRHIENIVKFRKACLTKIRHNGVTHETWLLIGHKLRRPEWQSNPVKTLELCTTFCLIKVCCTTLSAQLKITLTASHCRYSKTLCVHPWLHQGPWQNVNFWRAQHENRLGKKLGTVVVVVVCVCGCVGVLGGGY